MPKNVKNHRCHACFKLATNLQVTLVRFLSIISFGLMCNATEVLIRSGTRSRHYPARPARGATCRRVPGVTSVTNEPFDLILSRSTYILMSILSQS